MTTTLDVLSGGRAIHGLGAAWFESEHDAYGSRFPPPRERFGEDVGRDSSEIAKTRMAVVIAGPTQEEAQRKADAAGLPPDRVKMAWIGDPDAIAEQAATHRDAGIDAITLSMPDLHDPESLALVGRALAPVFA